MNNLKLLAACGFATFAVAAGANNSPTTVESIIAMHAPLLTPSIDLRLRSESVDQANGMLNSASANTLRYRLGMSTAETAGFSAFVQTESVSALGTESYNSGPGGNGNVGRPVVADPTGNELNQAYIHYVSGTQFSARVGRQRVIYDNARFIGNVGWRQNEQTLDALQLNLLPHAQIRLSYTYVRNINRIFFDNVDLDGQLVNLKVQITPAMTLTGYGYLLDFDGLEDSQTLGIRLAGSKNLRSLKLGYTAEYALQDPYADAPDTVNSNYRHLALSIGNRAWAAEAGQEVLGSNSSRGFSTPLATLHQFNGWADVFLQTPVAGLNDRYIGASFNAGKWSSQLRFHEFSADTSNQSYGRETDLRIGFAWQQSTALTLKFADYNAGSYGVDTTKLTLQVDYRL